MFRQICIALVTLVPPSQPHLQVIVMVTILTCYAAGASCYRPWKSSMLSTLDVIQTTGVTVFLATSASLLESHPSDVYFFSVIKKIYFSRMSDVYTFIMFASIGIVFFASFLGILSALLELV